MSIRRDADSAVYSEWTLMTSKPTSKRRAAVAILGAALAVPTLAQDTVAGTRGAAAISTEATIPGKQSSGSAER